MNLTKNIFTLTGLTLVTLSVSSYGIERLTPIKEPEVITPQKEQQSAQPKAWLGVAGQPVEDALAAQLGIENGVTLELVAPNGSAGKSGIKKFDIITKVGEKPIKNMNDLRIVMDGVKVNDLVDVEVLSAGKRETRKVLIEARPSHLPQRSASPKKLLNPAEKQRQAFQRKNLPPTIKHLPDTERDGIEEMMQNQIKQMEQHFAQMDRQMAESQKLLDQSMNLDLGDMRMKGHSNYSGTFTMSDNEGSIRMKVTDESGKHVEVKDKEGNVLYAGPYETEEDKKAVPAEVRARIDALGLENSKKGNRFHFRFGR